MDAGDDALAIDAEGNPLVTDLDGNPRICLGQVDMGAYELQESNSAPPQVTSTSIPEYTGASVTGVSLEMSEPVVGADARTAATYELLNLGPDREPGGGDDQEIMVGPSYVDGSTQIDLLFTDDQVIQLDNWVEHDYSDGAAGDWRIEDGGASVKQYVNAWPTFFVSDFDCVDRWFIGRIAVETASDDDFIGLVFAFQEDPDTDNPDTYYCLSWNQAEGPTREGVGEEGIKLLRVTATAGLNQEDAGDVLGDGENSTHVEVLASQLGSGTGWADNTEYEFSVRYHSDGRIELSIVQTSDDVFIWDANVNDPDPLGPGKVGFFNYSQSDVRYSGLLTADLLPEGAYQLTAHSGDPGLRDLDGIFLDGNGDGIAGDDYVYRFVVDQTAPQVTGASITQNELSILFDDDGGMDPTAVETLAHYTLVRAGGDGTIGDGSDIAIDLTAAVNTAVFDPATQTLSLTFAETLPDDVYQLTITAAGIVDLAGNPLDADVIETLSLDAVPASVSIELQPGSDSAARDNITNDTTPTFDVTVSEAGSFEVDWTGDAVADYTEAVTTGGTYSLTTPPLADGDYAFDVTFTAGTAGGSPVTDTLDVTIDATGPRVASFGSLSSYFVSIGGTACAEWYPPAGRAHATNTDANVVVSDTVDCPYRTVAIVPESRGRYIETAQAAAWYNVVSSSFNPGALEFRYFAYDVATELYTRTFNINYQFQSASIGQLSEYMYASAMPINYQLEPNEVLGFYTVFHTSVSRAPTTTNTITTQRRHHRESN